MTIDRYQFTLRRQNILQNPKFIFANEIFYFPFQDLDLGENDKKWEKRMRRGRQQTYTKRRKVKTDEIPLSIGVGQ